MLNDYIQREIAANFELLGNDGLIPESNKITVISSKPLLLSEYFCLKIITKYLQQDKECFIFSLKHTKQETLAKIISVIMHKSYASLLNKDFSVEDTVKYEETVKWLNSKKLTIFDGHFTAMDIYKKYKFDGQGLIRKSVAEIVYIDSTLDIISTRFGEFENQLPVYPAIKNPKTSVLVCSPLDTKQKKLIDTQLERQTDKIIELRSSMLL